jgi:uncharacterized protein DUF3606
MARIEADQYAVAASGAERCGLPIGGLETADRTRINMHEDYEVRYWIQKWNVSREQLAAAVRKVGVMVANVAKRLGKEAKLSPRLTIFYAD